MACWWASIPLWMGYLIATLMVLPLVVYGMKALTRLQVWTTPLWLVLMVVPVVWLIVKDPQLVDGFLHFAGKTARRRWILPPSCSALGYACR